MRRPSVRHLREDLARAARELATTLRSAGQRAWIVGGAVRDLALEREVGELDMTSPAVPDEVEALFRRTAPIGRDFGTVQVRLDGVSIEHTTFRSESVYRDARRPLQVAFGRSLEEDAARRDFTCNALYLDPLDDELRDPSGGLEDLERGRLRCVGEADTRFAEDALRMLRLARFAAALELEVDPAALAAARAHAERAARLAPERVAAELARVFERPRAGRAVRLLVETGVLRHALPGREEAGLDAVADGERRASVLDALGEALDPVLGLAVLYDPDLAADASREDGARDALERLRPSRATRDAVAELWRLRAEAERLGAEGERAGRARRVRLVAAEAWPRALRLARAWRRARGTDAAALDGLEAFRASLTPGELRPAPLIRSGDLRARRVPPGPSWGELLREAEDLQLEGRLRDRADALAWLDARLGGAGA